MNRYLLRFCGPRVEVYDETTGKAVFGPASYGVATRHAAHLNTRQPPLRPDRLAAAGAIDLRPPIRGRANRRLLLDAAIGVAIVFVLSFLALVALP